MLPESRGTTSSEPHPTERAAKVRLASTARRTEIIAAAIRVIARDGIRACTVSALEQETGFARGHFTYHFNAKEEIIGLAFATVGSDWAIAQMEGVTGDTARVRFESQIRTAARWGQQRPEYFRCLMNFRVEMMRDPSAFRRAHEIRAQFLEVASATIRQGMAEGDFRADLDPPWEARVVFALVDGFLMHAAMDVAFCLPEELADRAWSIVADRLLSPPSQR